MHRLNYFQSFLDFANFALMPFAVCHLLQIHFSLYQSLVRPTSHFYMKNVFLKNKNKNCTSDIQFFFALSLKIDACCLFFDLEHKMRPQILKHKLIWSDLILLIFTVCVFLSRFQTGLPFFTYSSSCKIYEPLYVGGPWLSVPDLFTHQLWNFSFVKLAFVCLTLLRSLLPSLWWKRKTHCP